MISYDPNRVNEALLRAAKYSRGRRQIAAEAAEYVNEAVQLLESYLPERCHRRVNETDIAKLAVAMALSHTHSSLVNEFLNIIADQVGYFPEVS